MNIQQEAVTYRDWTHFILEVMDYYYVVTTVAEGQGKFGGHVCIIDVDDKHLFI